MDEDIIHIDDLKEKVMLLGPIVAGLRKLLSSMPLSNDDKSVVERLVNTYGDEYDKAKKELKKLRKESKANSKPKKTKILKRKKPKKIDQIKLSYHKKMAYEIEKTHKISGYNSKKIKILQGGSPGLGKKS